jgi:hypothetical protein
MILDLNETMRVGGWASKGTVEKWRIKQRAKELVAAQSLGDENTSVANERTTPSATIKNIGTATPPS